MVRRGRRLGPLGLLGLLGGLLGMLGLRRAARRRMRRAPPAGRQGSGWRALADPEAAIVDRVTFNAHIIETGTQSYRLVPRNP
jgi:hypothetical protein